MLVSMAYGANNARTSVGVYALMYSIYSTGTVEQYASISITLRCMGAVGMGLGTLFCGFRLAPVTGRQQTTACLADPQAYFTLHAKQWLGAVLLYASCL